MQASETVLVLPGGYGDGPAFRDAALREGRQVVGASSVRDDPAAQAYPAWTFLPHVSDPGFGAALEAAVEAHAVDEIHASHYAVWFHIKTALPRLVEKVRLSLGRSNFDVEAEYARLRQLAAEPPAIEGLDAASEPQPPLTAVEAAGYLRAALSIPGESYEPKLLAMIEVARRTPQGDIVEIGSLFGRSAAFLALLSRRYGLGRILCIDPWSRDEIQQGDQTLYEASRAYDWEAWRLAFEINLAPFAEGRVNYIRGVTGDAEPLYASRAPVVTEAFGITGYEGRVALLHIDGNHAFDQVKIDADAWVPKVVPGGWIVFDDYQWDWGDGPRRVADAFLAQAAAQVRTHFVAGRALFVQLHG